jgi:hypothetical protein
VNERLAVPIPFPSKEVCEKFLASEDFAEALADFKADKVAEGKPVDAKAECVKVR